MDFIEEHLHIIPNHHLEIMNITEMMKDIEFIHNIRILSKI
jgi:hypothetical protein